MRRIDVCNVCEEPLTKDEETTCVGCQTVPDVDKRDSCSLFGHSSSYYELVPQPCAYCQKVWKS